LKSGALATAGAGILLAGGGDAIPSCVGGVADADVASLYSHAEPIVGARPNRASAVPIKILFMDHLLSPFSRNANLRVSATVVNPTGGSRIGRGLLQRGLSANKIRPPARLRAGPSGAAAGAH